LFRARVVGLDPTEYFSPCDLLGDPAVPPPDPRNLLGLTGVITQLRFIIDGTYTLAAPDGRLIIETYRTARVRRTRSQGGIAEIRRP